MRRQFFAFCSSSTMISIGVLDRFKNHILIPSFQNIIKPLLLPSKLTFAYASILQRLLIFSSLSTCNFILIRKTTWKLPFSPAREELEFVCGFSSPWQFHVKHLIFQWPKSCSSLHHDILLAHPYSMLVHHDSSLKDHFYLPPMKHLFPWPNISKYVFHQDHSLSPC